MPNIELSKIPNIAYYTFMDTIMSVLGWENCRQYRWLISDVESNYPIFTDEPIWIDGVALEQCLKRYNAIPETVQFIWAVFTAFLPETEMTDDVYPFAQSEHFWQEQDVKPQHPQAEFEIACWDSSAVLLIGLPDNLLSKIQAAYPDYKLL